MKNTIEYIAYLLDKAKKNDEPRAIIFLGAGASASAGIPLTHVIVRHIKLKYKDNPVIKSMITKKIDDYYTIMQALTSDERKDLFYYYITRKKVKINVTNIYLAQLLKENYVDFILTVNFDDLILRACGLFNFLPPVYDISNVKLPTTSNYREKSVIYMHGQHYGQWLLNNEEELEKVKEDVSNLFNEIKAKRTWIVVGYSGQDEIFNQITNLGCFSNELFWVSYLDNSPAKNVMDGLINKNNTNAYLLRGFDSDSFFLKLNSELDIDTPDIFNKPFSFLEEIVGNVKDLEDKKRSLEHEELFANVKERLIITKEWIDRAKVEIQEKDSVEKFKQEIIEAYTKDKYKENVDYFLDKIKEDGYQSATIELSKFFANWGISISIQAKQNNDKKLLRRSFEKYGKAIELDYENSLAYYNWGLAISVLAQLEPENAKSLLALSIEKNEQAIKLDPENHVAFNNIGNALSALAKLNSDNELYYESIEKYNKAIELSPEYSLAYCNLGNSLLALGRLNSDKAILIDSFKEYKKAIELNPKDEQAYNNWGISLSALAKLNSDDELYNESIEKFKKSVELNPKYYLGYSNWGNALLALAKLNSSDELYVESIEKYKKAIELNAKDDSAYHNWGNALTGLAQKLADDKFYLESFEKYNKAIELNKDDYTILDNKIASQLYYLQSSKRISKEERDSILQEAKNSALVVYEKTNNSYNLSCVYAKLEDKLNALKYLEKALENKNIKASFVIEDKDWEGYFENKGFRNLLENYK